MTICSDCKHMKWPYWKSSSVESGLPRCQHPAERIGYVGLFADHPECSKINTDGKCPHFEEKPARKPLVIPQEEPGMSFWRRRWF